MYDVFTTRYAFSCPERGEARVALSSFRRIEQLGGEIVGLAFVIELEFLEGRKHLEKYDVHSLITY